MKLTEQKLKQLIREEAKRQLRESKSNYLTKDIVEGIKYAINQANNNDLFDKIPHQDKIKIKQYLLKSYDIIESLNKFLESKKELKTLIY